MGLQCQIRQNFLESISGDLSNCKLAHTYFPPQSIDKLVTLELIERLKNSDFILESKIAELNQDKNSKQPD